MWVFDYNNVEIKMDAASEGLRVRGEISNRSSQQYNSVVFRIIVFAKNMPLGNTMFTINGFLPNQNRVFEAFITELTDRKIVSTITRWEIVPESGY